MKDICQGVVNRPIDNEAPNYLTDLFERLSDTTSHSIAKLSSAIIIA